MKEFMEPEVEIVKLDLLDVITESGSIEDGLGWG